LAAAERKKVPMLQQVEIEAQTPQSSSLIMEDRSPSPAKSSDNSDGKDHTRASTELTLRSDRNYVIQPKNIKLNEMFILQSLKN
jgi:hypothetical protein